MFGHINSEKFCRIRILTSEKRKTPSKIVTGLCPFFDSAIVALKKFCQHDILRTARGRIKKNEMKKNKIK